MSLENPPQIPFPLVKELADLLEQASREIDRLARRGDEGLLLESHLALEDYKTRVALNG